ncbi:MAG: hypothetical protein LBT59_18800 [Clostridiales bacterium]|jgi:hypothetical protein|nr:hypothetical protein [Clostridiales bacterium]
MSRQYRIMIETFGENVAILKKECYNDSKAIFALMSRPLKKRGQKELKRGLDI